MTRSRVITSFVVPGSFFCFTQLLFAQSSTASTPLLGGGHGLQFRDIFFLSISAISLLLLIVLAVYLASKNARLERAEKNLLRLATVMENTAEAMVFYDSNSVIEYVNPAFEKLTGYTSTKLLGHSYANFLGDVWQEDAWNRDAFFRMVQDAIRLRGKWVGNYTMRRQNGARIKVEATIAPIVSGSGEHTGFVSAWRDTTDREKQEGHLFLAQKMQALGTLAGGMAHDFNNVLQSIVSSASLLQEDIPENSQSYSDVESILDSADKGSAIIRQLIAFSRPAPTRKTLLNINACVADAGRLFKRLFDKRINFEFMPGMDLLPVEWDQGQIEQILVNLCANAREAMPEGGTLTVETGNIRISHEHREKNPLATLGDFVYLYISDTGPGIPPERQDRIFEPSFAVTQSGGETDFGLATVYGIIKQMGGFVEVENGVEIGTIFRLYFPASQGETPEYESKLPVSSDALSAGQSATILVAEDDHTVRHLIVRILTSAGYEIVAANNGEDAVALFLQNRDKVQLLLLDMIMPRMNGLKAAEHIRSVAPHIPVIFLSGYTADIILDKIGTELPPEILQKPFKTIDLLLKIKEGLESARHQA
ncbi:TPA: hypothetical protein DDW35_10325 [Candidatus Sumerlaeota bacterium]|jgi:two-component system, cell cycle sensor histidine kinase and response regulator CckA|nr:hypothetical protein [Candidatus Sumerlaeota bacterium]